MYFYFTYYEKNYNLPWYKNDTPIILFSWVFGWIAFRSEWTFLNETEIHYRKKNIKSFAVNPANDWLKKSVSFSISAFIADSQNNIQIENNKMRKVIKVFPIRLPHRN